MKKTGRREVIDGVTYKSRSRKITLLLSDGDIIRIDHHFARGDGDRHYVRVYYKDQTIRTIYDIDEVCSHIEEFEYEALSI